MHNDLSEKFDRKFQDRKFDRPNNLAGSHALGSVVRHTLITS